MARSIERYFRFMPKAHGARSSGRLWYPSADVYRTSQGWVVKVELAGVCSEDLEITIENATLHLTGCRRDSVYAETISCQQLEITYSRFEKTITFPCSIQDATIERNYNDGLLVLYLRSPATCED